MSKSPSVTLGRLVLEDGTVFEGRSFGAVAGTAGEVVFNTGMTGYPESLTDPSYRGQILTLTFPLVGNYGVPRRTRDDRLEARFESGRVQIKALLVADYCDDPSHWQSDRTLGEWLTEEGVPALTGIDTRTLTQRLRERGTMLGRLEFEAPTPAYDPADHNLVDEVSIPAVEDYGEGDRRVVLVDCGSKNQILHHLLALGLQVRCVPWDHDLSKELCAAIFVSNGPGDPRHCGVTVGHLRRQIALGRPIFGVCLGHQLLSMAAGAQILRLPYGHRGQNQPVREVGTNRCFVTSQNHGYATDTATLPPGWHPWFVNLNDGTNEGIRHQSGRFMSVQFHPEAAPGPVDTAHLFRAFLEGLS